MREGAGEVLKRLKSKARYTTEELCSKGERIYAEIKEKLEPTLNNKFVAIEAANKARERYPSSVFFLVRIGYPAAFRTKGGIRVL